MLNACLWWVVNLWKNQISIIISDLNRVLMLIIFHVLMLSSFMLKLFMLIFILAQLFHEHAFFLLLFLQKLLIIVVLVSLLFVFIITVLSPMLKLVVEPFLSLGLPSWIVHVWSHHFVFLILTQDVIDSLFIEQFFDNLLMFWNVFIHEVQTLCQNLHLIHDFLQLEGHNFC